MHSTKAGKIVPFNQEYFVRIFILFFFLAAVSLQAALIDGIAILVKEEPITLYDIEQKMNEEHLSQAQAVDALIREKLEAQEIKQRELVVTPGEVQERIAQIAQQNNLSTSQLYDAVWSTQHLTREAFETKLKKTMLTQKLYGAVAMANMEEPDEDQMHEYYRLHADKFSHPETFNVTVYHAPAQGELQRKMDNPMLNLPEVTTQEASLPYARIEPGLVNLLNKTKDGTFTPILPDPKGGYVAFFVRNRSMPVMQPFEQVKMQVQDEMMADKREQTLKDYFDRARLNADINIIRLPNSAS